MLKSLRLERLDLTIKHQINTINKKVHALCQQKQFSQAHPLIEQAKQHLKSLTNIDMISQLSSCILNAEASIYHHESKQDEALSILDEAILLEKSNIQSLARSYLNKCSILNDYKRHDQALAIAQKANLLLSGKRLKSPNRFERENIRQLYGLSFLTIGAQYQKMQRIEESLQAYEKGIHACRLWLGEKNKLTELMIHNLHALRKKNFSKKSKQKTTDRITDRATNKNSQFNSSIQKQKNFRIKELSTSKNSMEWKSRNRGSSLMKDRDRMEELANVYHPKLRSIELKTKGRTRTETDEMKDIERIKILYQPKRENRRIMRHKTEMKVDRREEDWNVFRSSEIST